MLFFGYREKKGVLSNAKTATRDVIEGIIYGPKKPTFDLKVRRILNTDDIGAEIARIKRL